jgi:hypothetical protein
MESLLNMYGLKAVIDRPTRIQNGVKSAIDQIILNTKVLSFKTEILETNLSDHFGQILTFYEDQLTEISSKFIKNTVKYMRVNNEENIQYLNFLLSKEDWMNMHRQHDVNIAYKEFVHIFTYYLDIAIPMKKVKMNKQQKKPRITSGIRNSNEKLKFLNRLIKGINVSIDLKNYYYNYKKLI